MSNTTYGSVLAEIDSYVQTLREKRAAEAGDTGTTHPSANVDDQTRPATEGARSAENEGDIVDSIIGPDVNSASAADAETPNKAVAMTAAAATGEDPKNETASAKGDKDDGTTTHPADAEKVGDKYASFEKLSAAIEADAVKVATELGNELLADIAVIMDGVEKQAADDGAQQAADQDAGQADAVKFAEAAGYEAAQALEQQLLDETREKAAAAQQAAELTATIQKEAEADAEMLIGYYESLAKSAEGEAEDEEATGSEGAALPPEDISALAAAANEGAAPAVPAPAEGGEIPPEVAADLAAQAAQADGGADEGAMADADEEQVVEALSDALAEAGVSPEELAQAVAAEQAGADVPDEVKAAAVASARASAEAILQHRDREAKGQVEKKASIELKYQVRQMVRDLLGK